MSSKIDDAIAKVLRVACKIDLTSLEKVQRKAIAVGEVFRDRSLGVQLKQFVDNVATSRRRGKASVPGGGTAMIERLCKQGMRQSAEILFIHFLPELKTGELRHVVSLAPTVRALAALCKAIPAAKRELETIALNEPTSTLESPIADWFLKNAKLDKSDALFSIALRTKDRPLGLPTPEELVRVGVKRDKKAALFRLVVSTLSDDNAAQCRFARVVLHTPEAAVLYAEAIRSQKLLKAHEPGVITFIRALASAAITESQTRPEIRRTASLALIRLVSGALILHPPDKPQPSFVHKALLALEDLELAADSEKLRALTWVAHPLKQNAPQSHSSLVSPEAAKVLKVAFDNVDQDTAALPLLESIAFNLGMAQLGTAGERVQYDPLLHEDTIGGLLPGDQVEVIRKGWSLHGRPVVKARVK